MDPSFKTFLIGVGILAVVILLFILLLKIEEKVATRSSNKHMKKLDRMINSDSENLTKT